MRLSQSFTFTIATITGLLVSSGCGGPDSDAGFEPLVLYLAAVDLQNEFFCSCDKNEGTQFFSLFGFGWATVSDCVANWRLLPPPIEECHHDVLLGLSSESQGMAGSAYECLAMAEDEYATCMMDLGCFLDPATCNNERRTNLAACPYIPYTIQQEIEGVCHGRSNEPSFSCEDGGEVRKSSRCNFEEDCRDGSDEIDCQ